MSDIVQAKFESIEHLAGSISDFEGRVKEMRLKVMRQVDALGNGAWEGAGSHKFLREMNAEILPGLSKLAGALEESASVVRTILYIFRQAEEEAVRQLSTEAALGGGSRRPDGELTLPAPHPPLADEGSGVHHSEDPSAADRAFEGLLHLGAGAWEADRPDAARHMRHYLGNSGETLEVDVAKMMRDMPQFEMHSQAYFQAFLQRDIRNQILQDYNGQPLEFEITSDWNSDFYATKSVSENWFYAMGGFSYSYSARVTVEPPTIAGENPIVEVDYQLFVHDVYNWDQGKMVTIDKPDLPLVGEISLPIPEEYQAHILDEGDHWRIYDSALAQLHTAGLAREYVISGHSDLQTLHYELDLTSHGLNPIQPPSAASEPGR
jgi:WXG100 family type VII secretion target